MFKIVDKKENKYLILDTDDGVIEDFSWEQVITFLKSGVVIEGCHETERGYHFDIDSSDYQVIYKGYKFRLYPNDKQKEYFAKCFGCARFIYNKMLADKIEHYQKTGENLIVYPSDYKDDFPFLKEVDSHILCQEEQHLQKAYANFFRNKDFGFPKFKSKKNNYKSFSTSNVTRCNTVEIIDNKYLKLPRSKNFGLIKVKISQLIRSTIKTVTISQVPSGKYYVSMNVAIWYQSLPSRGSILGIDLGTKDLVITSDGDKFDNIKTLDNHQKKLAKLQRQLAHKQRGSRNYEKARIKLAREYERIANIRKDYLHKISHKLISENQVIISEDLNVKGLMQNHRQAKSIGDASWYEFIRQLQYKADWNMRVYHKVDRFFPSSQLCSNCGFKYEDVKTKNLREWICPNCGKHHDRDVNAAINIKYRGSQDLGLLTA
ncbi:RNA-guided endonuclease TnpB family protein [Agathobacter sp.]|uniref:RNA-guided endonuclease TnpB family protein n=1 Tax=Agathobacter sp. TaxID=2021311 RepID=UPI003FD8830C